KTLTSAGFARVPAISEAGQVAMRGDIIDFFAPGLGEPLRVEFFDEEIESMRIFDLGSQRTRHVLKQVHVPLSREIEEVASAEQLLPLEEMPEKIRVFLWEPGLIEETAQRLRLQGGAWSAALARNDAAVAERNPLTLATLPGRDGTLDVLSVEEFCRGVADGLEVLAKRAKDGEKISICCSTEAEQSRVEHLLEEGGFDPQSIQLPVGGLTKGFRIPEARLTWLHHRELIPGHGQHRPKPRGKTHESDPVASATALKPGDIVVHAIHGLARFCGLDVGEPSKDAGAGAPAGEQDVLVLEFDGGSLLQVPAARVDLVERFIGAGGSTAPALDRLGSGSYKRRRLRVESAVEDLAASLLDVQARRASRSGTHFPVVPEQKEFDESFPWEDTPDQAQGAREIALDLADPKPMDRLVCGDVGYGKTEMAARALFAVVHHGWQAAVLVPTTVLAEQHTRTLRERFADWPIRIEQLSRIVSAKDQKTTLEGVASGRVDIVVGTHRILSQDVTFEKLGLVVIDEEQRFGVRAKNLLKRKRAEVDVLTLSATPIPRTLHMAMTGLRDITSLSTAPTGRQEITTEIRYGDEEGHIQTLLQAELARGGQAFFIHNRVKTLEHTAARLQRLMPNANIATGHGQMAPNDLEEAMLSFVRGDTDIFCSTTIVESGLDIANANTILIDDAHHYGLADLHQLRGRVGRSTRSGSCTLLIPRGQSLPEDARRRLKAVEELRYLGAGFQIAMRDLEIRGAGNLLGAEQSGHINAVGYETYRKLLAQSVARLKQQSSAGHPPRNSGESSADISIGVAAALPPTYVSDDTSRLELLRSFDKLRQPR
ncbi:MAG: DEAD/DEAH box helicase, partial [Planctomycetes bacterium]|nr:DEAD/DEAH box helicase [Planctomycetota bacterium]